MDDTTATVITGLVRLPYQQTSHTVATQDRVHIACSDSSRILSLRHAAQRSSVCCSNASAVQGADSPTAIRSRSPMPLKSQGATLTSIQFRRGDLNIDAQSQCSPLSALREISIPDLQPRCLRPSRLVLCDASPVGNARFAILVYTSIRTRLRLLSFYLLLSMSLPATFPSLPPQLALSLPHGYAIASS